MGHMRLGISVSSVKIVLTNLSTRNSLCAALHKLSLVSFKFMTEFDTLENIKQGIKRNIWVAISDGIEGSSGQQAMESVVEGLEVIEKQYGTAARVQIEREIGLDKSRISMELVRVRKVEFQKGRSVEESPKTKKLPGLMQEAMVKGSSEREDVQRTSNDSLDQRSSSEKLIAQAVRSEYIYGMLGQILGLSSIIGGVVLFLNGVAGSTSWTAKLLGLESNINDAAPGSVLFIVGLFLVRATRPKVDFSNLKG
jgi:hypothetical protein